MVEPRVPLSTAGDVPHEVKLAAASTAGKAHVLRLSTMISRKWFQTGDMPLVGKDACVKFNTRARPVCIACGGFGLSLFSIERGSSLLRSSAKECVCLPRHWHKQPPHGGGVNGTMAEDNGGQSSDALLNKVAALRDFVTATEVTFMRNHAPELMIQSYQ
eukprot:3611256-Amphidinium_carterae.1